MSIDSIINSITSTPNFQLMKTFRHHNNVSTYDHSVHVMHFSVNMCRKLHFTDDQIMNVIVGALLHDYFLYDWHKTGRHTTEGLHAWSHPKIALANAEKEFKLNWKQKNIIRSHMYPTSLMHYPKCKEAWIVCLSDKICAALELIFQKKYVNATI